MPGKSISGLKLSPSPADEKRDSADRENRLAGKSEIEIKKMAEATGLEPATSTVTGWHSNQLSYASASPAMRIM